MTDESEAPRFTVPEFEITEQDDIDFMRRRTNTLLMETTDGKRKWTRKRGGILSTMFNVNAPEDGENYDVEMTITREGPNRFLLTSYETGLFAREYHLVSDTYQPLEELAKVAVHSELDTR